MARILSQTLIRESMAPTRDFPSSSHILSLLPPSFRLLSFRWRSRRPEKQGQIFEVVLEAATEGGAVVSSPGSAAAARRLEDVIHGIIVRRAAPDWLPFIPGSSYWVPPRTRSYRFVEVVGRASSLMTEEEVMSLTTVRGWPCAAHLIGDLSPDSVEKPNEISTQSVRKSRDSLTQMC